MPTRKRSSRDAEEDEEDDEYSRKRSRLSAFIDDYAEEADDDDEEDDGSEGEDDFIDPNDEPAVADGGSGGGGGGSSKRRPLPPSEEEEDVEELERRVNERYGNAAEIEFDDSGDELTEADQQALLPSIKDPKLWMVKCAVGRERELAVCLMQKSIDRKDLQILSAIYLPSLKNYVYVEAFREAHVREACKGLPSVFGSAKIMLVPVKEMPAVVTVQCEAVGVSEGAWVRVKTGAYKGDLAKVVRVDNVRRQIMLKLIPRIDFAALQAKLDGREVVKKNKSFRPPQRFVNEDEARAMYIPVKLSKDGFMVFDDGSNMKFKDGFLYKSLSEKSLLTKSIQPTLDELDMYRKNEVAEVEVASLSEQFASLRKRHFVKNDRVIVTNGELKNMKGTVEMVEGNTVHIKPCGDQGLRLQMSLTVRLNEISKCFEPGNQVKAVGGAKEGSTGMVVRVEGSTVSVLSDLTKKLIRVFRDDLVETTEVSMQEARLDEDGDHDHYHNSRPPSQPATRPPRPAALVAQPRFRGGPVGRGGCGNLVGSSIKIRAGPHKGCSGIVKEVKGSLVRVELEAQMRNVMVQRDQIAETVEVSGSFRGRGGETPVYRSQTPLRPCMTPARDYGGATPVHEGMRTPMRHRAWNPYEPMTPTRDVLSMYQ